MELVSSASTGKALFEAAVACCQWLRPFWQEVSLQRCLGCALAAGCGALLWSQYGILRHARLPPHSLGLPIIGYTHAIITRSLEEFLLGIMAGRDAMLLNYLLGNVVIVSYPLYMKHLHKAELDGLFYPEFPLPFRVLMGENTIAMLPGGKGHPRHRRLRNKILASLGPVQVLSMTEDLLRLVRGTLDELAAKTAEDGYCTFMDAATRMASHASSLPITGGLSKDLQIRLEALLEEACAGLLSVPLNLGPLTQFGRSLRAKQDAADIIEQVMRNPPEGGRQNIIADLMKASEDGAACTREEIVDTTVTLMGAGQLTTADSLPPLFVYLASYPDWASRIAEEPLQPTSIEADSATLRFIREVLRLRSPAGGWSRKCPTALDLGEHGHIPAGCHFAVFFKQALNAMGPDFNPDRWTSETVREHFLSFGANQPHACVGRNLALLELQLFARVLCREYDFEALDTKLVANPRKPLALTYANMLRVRVRRKSTA